MPYPTADISDAHPEARVADPIFADFGGELSFHWPVLTLKVFEDNQLVREALEEPGEGRVLVVDGGGSTRCALVGGNLGALAVNNGWAGIVVYGCVRDSDELAQQAVGVKALACHPRKSNKGQHGGARGLTVRFAEIDIRPGDWLYADADGIVVGDRPLHD